MKWIHNELKKKKKNWIICLGVFFIFVKKNFFSRLFNVHTWGRVSWDKSNWKDVGRGSE